MSEGWRPSNGTEGELFYHHRCRTCVNDRFDFTTLEGGSCPIWMNALMHIDDSHLYWDASAKSGECDMYYPTAKAHAAALDAALEAVDALKPMLNVDKYKGGYDCCGCNTPSLALADALDAIDALKEKP